jgi:hypothetical protein
MDFAISFSGCEKGDFAARRAFECQRRRLDEIKEVFVPNIHPDDTPATGKSLGEGGKLCGQPFCLLRFKVRRCAATLRCWKRQYRPQ